MARWFLPGLLGLLLSGCTLLYDTDELGSAVDPDALNVLETEPSRVPRGNGAKRTITVRGSGFGRGAEVRFGGDPVDHQFVSENELIAEVEDDIGIGAIDVTVTLAGGESGTLSAGFYLYFDPIELSDPTTEQLSTDATWAGWNGQLTDMVFEDVIGSPDRDLVLVANNLAGDPGNVIFLQGDGTGSFTFDLTTGFRRSATVSDARAVVFADVDGDGIGDAATVGVSGAATGYVVFGSDSSQLDLPAGSGGIGVAAVDDDGDGTSQLALLRSTNADSEYLQLAAYDMEGEVFEVVDSYTPPENPAVVDPADDDFGNESFSFSSGFNGGAEKGNLLVAADFDGDGVTDLAAPVSKTQGSETTAIGVFWAASNGLEDPDIVTFNANIGGVASLTAVDVNADGNPDMVAGLRQGDQIVTLLGSGDGNFSAVESSANVSVSEHSLADVNLDGYLDIWTCDREPITGQPQRIALHLGNSEYGFESVPAIELAIPAATGSTILWCGALLADDLDGDGLADLVLPHSEQIDGGEIELYLSVYINESDS